MARTRGARRTDGGDDSGAAVAKAFVEGGAADTPGGDRRQHMDQVGPRLRQAREARGFSLREMARRIGVSPSFVSQVETGKASPSVGTLYSLVNELGLSLDEVMGDEQVASVIPGAPAVSAAPAMTAAQAIPATEVTVATLHDAPAPAVSGWHRPGEEADGVAHVMAPSWWPRIEVPLQPSTDRPAIRLAGVTWERLTHEDDPLIDFLHVTYSPGGSSCAEENLMRHGGREYGYVISGRIDVQVGFELYKLRAGDSLHFDSTTPHRLSNPYAEPCVALWVVVARKGDTRVMAQPDLDTKHLPGLL
jgi:transcriptional regulator with XRE-family HTH domain/mannose-6-phosphate isomerase-like protein (cupin superfamily)